MANIFTVKHGSGQPNGILIPFELGFDETGKKLYIGGAKKADGTLGDAIPITTPIEEMIIQSDTAGKMVYFNNNKLYATNLFIIPSDNIGKEFPSSPKDGQVYFIIKG